VNIGVKYGLYAVLAYILVEVGMYAAGIHARENIMVIRILLCSVFLFLAVALSILINYNKNRHGGLSLLVDLKTGIGASAVFALTASLFFVVYFSKIDTEFLEVRRQVFTEYYESAEGQEYVIKYLEENPRVSKEQSVGDIVDQNIENLESMLQPGTMFPMALFSLLLMGMVYSFGVTGLNRLVLAKLI